jgi:hypothetical protein
MVFAQDDGERLVQETKSTAGLDAAVSDENITWLFPPPLCPDGSYDVPETYPAPVKTDEVYQPRRTTIVISKENMRVATKRSHGDFRSVWRPCNASNRARIRRFSRKSKSCEDSGKAQNVNSAFHSGKIVIKF